MPQVTIRAVVSGPIQEQPFMSHGKQQLPVKWYVNGLVDGQPAQNIKLRALSQKVHWAVFPGNTVITDPPHTHKGETEFKITTPSEANGYLNAQGQTQAPAQTYTPPPAQQPQPTYAPPQHVAPQTYTPPKPPMGTGGGIAVPDYTLKELEDLLAHSYRVAKGIADGGVPETLTSLCATLFIQATKCKLKAPAVSKAGSMNAPMKDKLLEEVWKVIYDKGLGERANNCNLTDDLLLEWWKQANADINAFAIRVNYELQQSESGAE